ncbi:hypothetical protein GobsT_12160 [Gemmata obscuriglobus]|uniref:Uncharacterized protein n=1 Tax=Gemmata obscuriglobus TaxID=114 RepID=A0A2Z3HBG9_9BACT|nr:hypothetical protein [Gemmata obscuriglobus]AWM40315.1 hypothetical protein C1280_27130 [Gemmata obscuriglobus]QEG26476.1 hypothetical protein GobsT_12160 [Gemmata obscuriglobus]VTS01716.1 unnamed protein product [Gemmata obscuriglobus UQM 2246]
MADETKKAGARAGHAKGEPPAPKPGARVCDPTERAGEGLKRFKLRLEGHPFGARTQRYVLAPDRDSAVGEYLRAEGIDPGDVDGAGVRVVATELPD